MKIFKVIIGSLLILIAGLLLIALLFTFPDCINRCITETRKSGSSGIGFIIGTLVGNGIFIVIILFCVKKGLKLIRKKSPLNNQIDEIGL